MSHHKDSNTPLLITFIVLGLIIAVALYAITPKKHTPLVTGDQTTVAADEKPVTGNDDNDAAPSANPETTQPDATIAPDAEPESTPTTPAAH